MTLQQMSDALKAKETEIASLHALETPTVEQAKAALALSAEIVQLKSDIDVQQKFLDDKAKFKPTPAPVENEKGLLIPDNARIQSKYAGQRAIAKHLPNDEVAYKLGLAFQSMIAGTDGSSVASKKLQENYGISVKTMTEGNNAQGGYLVPTELSSYIINLMLGYGVFPQHARVEPMSSDTKEIIRFQHGIAAYWGTETGSMTASQEAFDRVSLSLNKLYSLAALSYELEEDAIISVADVVANEMARQGAKKIDEAGFNGDASSTYSGITGARTALTDLHGTIAYIAGLQVASGNAYSEVTAADCIALKGKLPAYARNANTRWFMSPDVYSAIPERLILAAAGVLPNDLVNGVGGERFLGIPVVLTEVMPKVEANSQVCMLLGDLSLSSTFGKGSQVAMLRDTSVGWSTDTIQYKTRWRVDCVTHDVGNAHATATSRQAGPLVGLILAAA